MIAPDEAIHLLSLLGLRLEVSNGRLNVSPAELIDNDTRWLIRKNRDAIIAGLQSDEPCWAWLVTFETHALEVYMHPEVTHAEMEIKYPIAIRIAPLPECLWPHDQKKEQAA